jgi:hypothetical protein
MLIGKEGARCGRFGPVGFEKTGQFKVLEELVTHVACTRIGNRDILRLVTGRRRRRLLAVLAVVMALPACSSSSGPSAAASRAGQICGSFVPRSVPTTVASAAGSEEISAGWTTAGQITTHAQRALGRTLHPWDQLPASHFVAECGYLDLTLAPSRAPNCPGTTLPSTGPNASQEFYVDDEHHSTAAIPPTSLLPSFCAYGLVAPTSSSNP